MPIKYSKTFVFGRLLLAKPQITLEKPGAKLRPKNFSFKFKLKYSLKFIKIKFFDDFFQHYTGF